MPQTLEDAVLNEAKLSFLLKGPVGYGKTIAAASLAIEGPVHLSYFDKKFPVELLRYFKYRRPDIYKNIHFDVYGANNAHEYLNFLKSQISNCQYFAEIADSVTNMTAAAVNWSLAFRTPGGKKDEINPNAMKLVPDFEEYKVETSYVTQALDMSLMLPCHVIWIAHPLPKMDMSQAGDKMRVVKTNSIVSYGSKVAGIIPGRFSEIYHFAMDQTWNAAKGRSENKRMVLTEASGDDFAKSSIGLTADLDITDRLFWEVWKDSVSSL